MTDDEMQDILDEAAAEPESMAIDGEQAKSRPLTDLIEVDKYRRKLANSAARKARGISVAKIIPPGMAD